jgi:WhiB family redox-sensing transcriptional regulator
MDETDSIWPADKEFEQQNPYDLREGLDQQDWQERALCAQTDPEAFFPEKGGSTREAKRICAGCEVRAECLEYALTFDERFGIWGGLSERERRRLKRRVV